MEYIISNILIKYEKWNVKRYTTNVDVTFGYNDLSDKFKWRRTFTQNKTETCDTYYRFESAVALHFPKTMCCTLEDNILI